MGIETDSDIDYGRIFGPFPDVGQIYKSFFIGLLTTDEHDDSSNIKVNMTAAGLSVTWLPYIRAARNEEEQNMEAYTKNGQIYYRTLRIIRSGEELLVWYSKDFAKILEIPEIKAHGNDDKHVCDACGATFRHPYPLIAHIKFRCLKSGYGTGSTLIDATTTRSRLDKDPRQLDSHSSVASKRFSDTDDYPMQMKRLFESKLNEVNNNISPKVNGDSSSTVSFNSTVNDVQEPWSAFKKVEKSKVNDTGSKHVMFPECSLPVQNIQSTSIRLKYEMELNKLLTNKYAPANGLDKETSQSMGMFFSGNWMLPKFLHNQNNVMADSQCNKVLAPSIDRTKTSDIQNLPKLAFDSTAVQAFNNDTLHKQMLIDELQSFQLSHFKPNNPMVDKIIHTTSPALLQRPMRTLGVPQNWCAKCNASFRMTSDLVYHMRSHHKREFDPMKRKREEKLQCNVCRETFKERHHLTRHMTSHT